MTILQWDAGGSSLGFWRAGMRQAAQRNGVRHLLILSNRSIFTLNNFIMLCRLTTYFLLLLSGTLVAQDEYVDLSFGEGGSTNLIYTNYYGPHPSTSFDSLGNIYLSFLNNSSDLQALLKIKPDGNIDSTFGINGALDSLRYYHFQKDNYIISRKGIGGSTIICAHDLNMNFLDRFVVPGNLDLINFRYDSAGYLIGHIRGGTMFKYKNGASLDSTFGNDGILEFNTIPGIENSSFYWDGYRDTDTDGNHILRIEFNNEVGNRNAMTAILDSIGQIKKTLFINDISPIHINLDKQYLSNDHIIISGYRNLVDYLLKTTTDGEPVTEFGVNGRIEYKNASDDVKNKEVFIGEFSNGQILSATEYNGVYENIFLMNQKGEYATEYGNDGYIDLITRFNVVRDIDIYNDEIYVVHRDSVVQSNFYLSRMKLGNVSTTGTELEAKTSSITLQPNPASSQILLHYTGQPVPDGRILIYDVRGQLVKSISRYIYSETEINIDISDLQEGTYFITLMQEGHIITHEQLIIGH